MPGKNEIELRTTLCDSCVNGPYEEGCVCSSCGKGWQVCKCSGGEQGQAHPMSWHGRAIRAERELAVYREFAKSICEANNRDSFIMLGPGGVSLRISGVMLELENSLEALK